MLPQSWPEVLDRLGRSLVADGGGPAGAEEWLRQAVRAAYSVGSLHGLSREQRLVAFQRTCGVVLALEDDSLAEIVVSGETGQPSLWWGGTFDPDPDPADPALDPRQRVAALFARYFAGVALKGPPWAMSPLEQRPSFTEWAQSANFPMDGGETP